MSVFVQWYVLYYKFTSFVTLKKLYGAFATDCKNVPKVRTYLIAGALCEEKSSSYRRALGQQVVARLKENAHFDTLW